MIELTLPWPPRILSPNARAHWAPKAKAVRSYRHAARILLTHAQNCRPGTTVTGSTFDLTYTFCPSTKRAFDLDNALSMMKAATDGIAEALCVNDSSFRFHIERGEVVKGGCVKARLSWS